MSEGSQVNSGREVSWNSSMYTVSRLDDEASAALALEVDPLGALNSLFAVRWHTMLSLRKSKLSGLFLPLCQHWFPLAGLYVCDFLEECALALEPLLAGIQIVLLTKLCPHSLPLGPILVVH